MRSWFLFKNIEYVCEYPRITTHTWVLLFMKSMKFEKISTKNCSNVLILVIFCMLLASWFGRNELRTHMTSVQSIDFARRYCVYLCLTRWDTKSWDNWSSRQYQQRMRSLIAKFMGPIWGPPGPCRPQMGPMLAPWTLLSGVVWMNTAKPSIYYHSLCLVLFCCATQFIDIFLSFFIDTRVIECQS